MEERWQVKGWKVAVYRGKNAGKLRECGRYMEARWQVIRGKSIG